MSKKLFQASKRNIDEGAEMTSEYIDDFDRPELIPLIDLLFEVLTEFTQGSLKTQKYLIRQHHEDFLQLVIRRVPIKETDYYNMKLSIIRLLGAFVDNEDVDDLDYLAGELAPLELFNIITASIMAKYAEICGLKELKRMTQSDYSKMSDTFIAQEAFSGDLIVTGAAQLYFIMKKMGKSSDEYASFLETLDNSAKHAKELMSTTRIFQRDKDDQEIADTTFIKMFLDQFTLQLEIVQDGKRQTIYFLKTSREFYLSLKSRLKFNDEYDPTNYELKIESLLKALPKFNHEMDYFSRRIRLSKWSFLAFKLAEYIDYVILALCVIANLALYIGIHTPPYPETKKPGDSDVSKSNTKEPKEAETARWTFGGWKKVEPPVSPRMKATLDLLNYLQIAACSVLLLKWLVLRLGMKIDRFWHNPNKTWKKVSSLFTSQLYNQVEFRIAAVSLACVLLSMFHHYIWVSFALLNVINYSRNMRYIFKAITAKGTQLIMTGLLGLVIMSIYASVGFWFLRDYFLPVETINGDPENPCYSLASCFVTIVNHGFRNGGGFGDITYAFDPNSFFVFKLFTDLTFYMLMNVIFLQLVFGIILDTFTELREQSWKKSNYLPAVDTHALE
jgi:hypothetical protein